LNEQKEESKETVEERSFQECINCGRKIPKNTRFCRECGKAQTKDAFPLLIIGCIVTILAVFFAWQWASPYSLVINIAVPIIALVIFALILSFMLWR
jgi:predicted amidophosphoribosyltransferase